MAINQNEESVNTVYSNKCVLFAVMRKGNPSVLRLWGRCLIFIIFGGMIYVLADKSITMHGFTSCMVNM